MTRLLTALFVLFALPAHGFVTWMHTPNKDVQCSAAFEADGITLTCNLLNVAADVDVMQLPQNDTCTQTWGRVFQIKAQGEVTVICAPEPTFQERSDELGIHKDILLQGIRCMAGTDAISCQNRDQRGFALSSEVHAVH